MAMWGRFKVHRPTTSWKQTSTIILLWEQIIIPSPLNHRFIYLMVIRSKLMFKWSSPKTIHLRKEDVDQDEAEAKAGAEAEVMSRRLPTRPRIQQSGQVWPAPDVVAKITPPESAMHTFRNTIPKRRQVLPFKLIQLFQRQQQLQLQQEKQN